MDEEQIFHTVEDRVGRHPDEVYENKVYSVCDRDDLVDKVFLKSKFKQGDRNLPHTEVKITIGKELKVVIENSPIYIYGEYIKMSRNMTQTPLRVERKLKCERSVSDFCTQVKSFFLAKYVTFIPAGREDFDVRMVEGRPFLLEIKDPKRNLGFNGMKLCLHGGVSIINFKMVEKECKRAICGGEGESKKTYRAFLCCKEELEIQETYRVEQRTPLRVLHRRANLLRSKDIRIVDWDKKMVDDWFYYLVTLEASAGTYIKEFVNGDFGRTVPSLGTKENYCDLLELDVLRIEKKEIDSFVVRDIELEIVHSG